MKISDGLKISSEPLTVWALSDAHVGTDLQHGRESLADALRQSESENGFDWDVAVNLGDHSGTQGAPDEAEGREVVRQYESLTKHRREQVYDIGGNHDRSDLHEEEGAWFKFWLDPTGINTSVSGLSRERRPYPVTGNWERYSFQIGNILFLMMSDRNESTRRLPRSEGGGNPSGVVTEETFEWWRDQVERHPNHLIITTHHYVLKDTTVASGEWEGCWQEPGGIVQEPYHGFKPRGTPRGASYLYFVGGREDAQRFERYLERNNSATDLWLGGHTHSYPDDMTGGKSHVERRWGTHFVNVSALTKFHKGSIPMSRVLTFTPGKSEVVIRCYLHTDDYAPQGFYEKAERVLRLSRPFSWDCH